MSTTTDRPRFSSNVLLWASAFVLAGLVILAAGRPLVEPATADMVVSQGAHTMMTADAGNDEILLILNNRNETLTIYRVVNQNSVELFRRYDLPQMFSDARARATGRR